MIVVFTLSSFASIVPEPSVSNRSNASLISCFCSSVNSGFGPDLKQIIINRSFSLSRNKKINWKLSSGRGQENEML